MSLTTRWFPRTVERACKKLFRSMAYKRNSSFKARLGSLNRHKNRCSTETYSSPMAFASSSALMRTLLRSLVR